MNLTDPIFSDETAAREYLEATRWPDGPVCPHCREKHRVKSLVGKSYRPGLRLCLACRKQFSVTVGTVFERSKVPLHKWLLATHMLASSKKGMSAHQLHRSIGVTYKTAWFMFHRIREAMRSDDLSPFGGSGGAVEADETFIGREPGNRPKQAYHHKMKVISLIDRQTGRARSVVIDDLKANTIDPIILENIDRESRLMTDEAGYYIGVGETFTEHGTVNHSAGDYGRGDVHTNTVEGFFSIFKRGMKGIYQHCGKQHLHRYVAEFDFRYSNRSANGIDDTERAKIALMGIEGRRLTYRRTNARASA